MGLCPVLGCSPGVLVRVLEPCVVAMDEQRPVMTIAVNDVPHTVTLRSRAELGKQVRTLEWVELLYQWSGISVGNLHSISSDTVRHCTQLPSVTGQQVDMSNDTER